jgi:hypothetical protein
MAAVQARRERPVIETDGLNWHGRKEWRQGVAVDYDVFMHVPHLDARDLERVQMVYKAEDFDFRLKPGSAAVDHGVTLFNVTDGFTGQAPDLGALECGQAPPHYGPRR